MTAPAIHSADSLRRMTFEQACAAYKAVIQDGRPELLRWMAQNDRFFLLTCTLGRRDAIHPWIYERCREVEAEPEGTIDLWSRFHYKSTVITLAGAVQEILRDPEVTIGIFSHVIGLSKKFVKQIQRALEDRRLVTLFPDILHARPPQRNWSAQDGLVVQRSSNPKEPTVQAAGLVDGSPVGAHYSLRIYDDIVTDESVSTPDQIAKTTEAWELSLALGTSDGGRAWYAGTRYHPDDTYQALLDRGALRERRRICYGADGRSVLMPDERLAKLRREMGERTFAAQMLQEPVGAGVRMFRDEWIHTLEDMPERGTLNVHVLIDSANAKRKTSDYTTMQVWGLGRDRNYYLLDALRDRLNLAERTRALFGLVERWTPTTVWWEQIGLASDIQHIQIEQDRSGWHFSIRDIHQSVPKQDRIGWLVPLFEQARIWLPNRILRQRADGETYDFIHDLIHHEYSTYPVARHDDMLDCMANLMHPDVAPSLRFPVAPGTESAKPGETWRNRTRSEWKPRGWR